METNMILCKLLSFTILQYKVTEISKNYLTLLNFTRTRVVQAFYIFIHRSFNRIIHNIVDNATAIIRTL